MSETPRRFLFAMYDSGGNVPPLLAIVRELARRGHRVRVLAPSETQEGDPAALRRRVERAGAEYVARRIGRPHELGVPPRRGLAFGRTSRAFGPLCNTYTQYMFAPGWAEAVADLLAAEDADAVAADHMLPGVLVGAEAAGRPAAALLHTIYFFRPAPGLPPTGVGFFPARDVVERVRDRALTAAIDRVYRRDAVPAMNVARRRFGLDELTHPFEEYDRAGRVLVLTSPSFDLPARELPPNVRYTGMPFEPGGAPAGAWTAPWPERDERPLVVVAFSTNAQGQEAVLRRLLPALGQLDVRGLVTLGPSLRKEMFAAPGNVWLEPWVPHDVVMPGARLVITHGGHGTVMQALRHGVPVACVPLCCDQYDVAVRVVLRRVGARIAASSSVDQLASAVRRVLHDDGILASARRLGARIRAEDGAATAADELERLAEQGPGARSTASAVRA